MADNVGIYKITADLQRTVSTVDYCCVKSSGVISSASYNTSGDVITPLFNERLEIANSHNSYYSGKEAVDEMVSVDTFYRKKPLSAEGITGSIQVLVTSPSGNTNLTSSLDFYPASELGSQIDTRLFYSLFYSTFVDSNCLYIGIGANTLTAVCDFINSDPLASSLIVATIPRASSSFTAYTLRWPLAQDDGDLIMNNSVPYGLGKATKIASITGETTNILSVYRVLTRPQSAPFKLSSSITNTKVQLKENGRTTGITADKNAYAENAVLTCITGALAELTGVNPGWFLGTLSDVYSRPSGSPYIPDRYTTMASSSASDTVISYTDVLSGLPQNYTAYGSIFIEEYLNSLGLDATSREMYSRLLSQSWSEKNVTGSYGF